MGNRHDDTPEINDYTYHVFEEIEKRGLQFAIPEQWRPVYRAFLRKRKRRREEAASAIAGALLGIAKAFESACGSNPSRYSQDFGDKGAATREESPKANNTTRPLEE
jgi:hypothetical protein